MDIGALNKRITFQKSQEIEDEMQQDKIEWFDYKTVWATVKPYKSSESSFMSKLKPEVTHRMYIRYRNDITADMRIIYHNSIFEINGNPIDIDEKHEMLEIQCHEVFENEQYSV